MRPAQLGIVVLDPLDFLLFFFVLFFGRHIFWRRAVSLRSYFSLFLSSFVSMLQVPQGDTVIGNAPLTLLLMSHIDIYIAFPEGKAI